MLASLIRQSVQERSSIYIIASLGLAIYVTVISTLFRFAVRNSTGGSIFTDINRFLFWKTYPSVSFDVDWFNILGIAVVLPLAVITVCMLISDKISLHSGLGTEVALLLTYPTTRTQIFLNLFAFQAVQTLFVCAISTLFLVLGTLAAGAQVQVGRIFGIGFSLWLLSVFFALTSFLVGNLTCKIWVRSVIPAGIFILGVLLYVLPGFTHLPAWIRWFSPIAPYIEGNVLAFGLNPLNWLIQAGWGIAVSLAAWLHFDRVDFP